MKLSLSAVIYSLAVIFICTPAGIAAPEVEPQPITLEQVTSDITELQPIIEEIVGKKFKKTPNCMIVSTETLIRIDTDRWFVQFQGSNTPGPNSAAVRRVAEGIAKAECIGIVGTSHPDGSVIYIVPDEIQKSAKGAGIAVSDQVKWVKLILAHELAHAVRYQYISSNGSRSIRESDAEDAACAVDEGFAMFIEDQVARRLALEDVQRKHEDYAYSPATLPKEDTPEADRQTAEMQKNKYRYLDGRDFLAWHFQKGGIEAVWKILSKPPATSRMIFHPETYSPTLPPGEDYRHVLTGFEKRFGTRKWKITGDDAGAERAREMSAYFLGTPSEAYWHIDNWQNLDLDSRDSYVSIRVFVMETPPAAGELVRALNEWQTKSLEAGTKRKAVTKPFSGITADEAVCWSYVEKKGKKTVSLKDIKVVRERVGVCIRLKNVELSDAKARILIGDIFRRLPAGAWSK